jgi:hypothetical protein
MAIRPVKKDKVTLLRQSGSDRPPELRLAFANRDPDTELVVDNFAGGGGASIGMEMGLDGRKVDLAFNHCAEAIALHKANHPETIELPTGQVSFHSATPLTAHRYAGEWDGAGMSETRIIAYAQAVLEGRRPTFIAPPPKPVIPFEITATQQCELFG